jgi:DNA-binding CsgD family transcriptional regulator
MMKTTGRDPWSLSNREVETLDMLIMWGSQKAAAREMDISVRTLETHVTHIKKKMGIINGSSFQHLLCWDRFRHGRHEKGRSKAASAAAGAGYAAGTSAAGAL